MKPRILIVEDEPAIAFGLEVDLTEEGYDTTLATDGEQAGKLGRDGRFDLILLDVMLPKKDGFEVCREIRRAGVRTPILMLTAKSQDVEKVVGLDLGADDYVTKPFSPMELRARIRALLRRGSVPVAATGEVDRFGDVELDHARGEVRRAGVPVEMTPTEFKLLGVFVKNRGRVLSRDRLIDLAWGPGAFVTERVVDNYIVSLRRKLEADPAAPRFFVNVRGQGYRFDG
jgi:DNA-binding response OmpR family regulator